MGKETFSYKSADGISMIHAVRWIPEGNIRAVMQIAHGMAEYIDRYEAFAQEMNRSGVLVTGNDHLGHGHTVTDPSELGFFSETEGNRKVLNDMQTLLELTKAKYPGLPYFLLGHSMGSFLSRQFIASHGKELSGAVLTGTGEQPRFLTALAGLLCRGIGSIRGSHYRSTLVNDLAFGSYNKGFGKKGGNDWLSTRKECVAQYDQDPLCGFLFTVSAYHDLFGMLSQVTDRKNTEKIPKDLPVLILSGEQDPVGDFGKAPKLVAEKLKKTGIQDVQLILYPGDRHEILGEKDRETVIRDITEWMDQKINQKEVQA